jgi:hypothetical protein
MELESVLIYGDQVSYLVKRVRILIYMDLLLDVHTAPTTNFAKCFDPICHESPHRLLILIQHTAPTGPFSCFMAPSPFQVRQSSFVCHCESSRFWSQLWIFKVTVETTSVPSLYRVYDKHELAHGKNKVKHKVCWYHQVLKQ